MRGLFIALLSSILQVFILAGFLKLSAYLVGVDYTYWQMFGFVLALRTLLRVFSLEFNFDSGRDKEEPK